MGPYPPPKPPELKRGLLVPLAVNGALMLVFAVVASFMAGGSLRGGNGAVPLFFLLVGLFFLNGLALVVAAFMSKSRWVIGFLLSGLLVFLVGLGSCGLMLSNA